MSVDQHALEELAHIGRMVTELERMALSGTGASHGGCMIVMRPEYWRQRIDALMASAKASEPLRRDAEALRERLASLAAAF